MRKEKTVVGLSVGVSVLSLLFGVISGAEGRSPFLEAAASIGDVGYSGDRSELDFAISRARKAGFTVSQERTFIRTVPRELEEETLRDVEEDYGHQAGQINRRVSDFLDSRETEKSFEERMKNYERELELYNEAESRYPKDLEAYEAELKTYERSVETQITDADPSVALNPDRLAVEQPFTLKSSRSSIVPPEGFLKEKGEFSSDSSYSIRDNLIEENGSYSFTWRNMAMDKETGKTLNAKITLDQIVVDGSTDRNGEGRAMVKVYSNYSDNFSINGITSLRQTLELTYEDGSPYDKQYYVTVGSLNAQGRAGERREFAAPGEGVKASFVNSGSAIVPEVQDVSGSASRMVKKAFMLPAEGQGKPISDSRSEALGRIGVTFLVDNGASFYTGVSGSSGEDPKPVQSGGSSTGGAIRSTYNHILVSSQTVAETVVKPKKPELPVKPVKPERESSNPGEISYRLSKIVVD